MEPEQEADLRRDLAHRIKEATARGKRPPRLSGRELRWVIDGLVGEDQAMDIIEEDQS